MAVEFQPDLSVAPDHGERSPELVGDNSALARAASASTSSARVRALTRSSGQAESALIQTDGLTIDLLSRHTWRGDERIELSSREFALLEYFMRHGGQVLSRQQMLSAIWDYDFQPASNVLDVYVRHLRNKVDPTNGPSLIQAVAVPVTASTPRQTLSGTARLPENFKMKEISSV